MAGRLVEILDLPISWPHIVAVRDMQVLRELAPLIAAFAPKGSLATLPEWDCLPFDAVSPSLGVMGERAGTLRWLAGPGDPPRVVLTTVSALCQRLPPICTWSGAHLELRAGECFDQGDVESRLRSLGYLGQERVEETGQFAVHGQTMDIFPAAAPRPCRVQHEKGIISEIRSYDVDTQRSIALADVLIVDPATEIVVTDGVEAPRPFSGHEHHMSRYYPKLVTLFDYLPTARLLLADDDDNSELFFEQIEEGHRIAARDDGGLYLSRTEWSALVAKHQTISRSVGVLGLPASGRQRRPTAVSARVLREVGATGDKLLLTGEGAALMRASRDVGKALGRPMSRANAWTEVTEAQAGTAFAMESPLRTGFRVSDYGLTVVAAADLLPDSVQRGTARPGPAAGDVELQIGDVAIDRDHGLCVFEGLESISGGAASESEALRLQFAGDDVLMVPVAQADRIWRYGSEPEAVSLDRLDGGAWEARRQAVEAGIAKTARAMAALAKQRLTATTAPVLPDHRSMDRFASGFRYNLTPDQTSAIDDVLDDLASSTPMDRLVCGDVGFGKTEVALRAAAAAVFAGRQAALVAPTTVLVRQHAETLQRRFARFGIEVAQLSRLVSAAEARRVRAGLADGSIRLVVGTQALAGSAVAFRDLALTIIDEEQRFGAKMKGRLRALGGRSEVPGHVLTLTATPIPRTLQSALSGLQALSMLTTPPDARQPVRTLVEPFDLKIVSEALLRERARGGQSFVVCPRIEDLDPIAAKLTTALPDLAMTIAHGALNPADMDERLVRFADGESDVLIATSIIESGLDLPRANTMIVCNADRFGLAELHQLRGRVGRGQRRGVVILTTDAAEQISSAAKKRLQTVKRLDRLGSGLAIAARDLDLRGAGDLVGEDQAGHVERVGLGLYQHLLQLALAAASGKPKEDWSPELVIGPSGSIPTQFVPDAETRLALYIRILRAESGSQISSWLDEVVDRFGPAPAEISQLVQFVRLRVACRKLGITRLIAGPKGIAAEFRPRRTGAKRIVSDQGSNDPTRLPRMAEQFLAGLSRRRNNTSSTASKRQARKPPSGAATALVSASAQ